MLGVRVRGGAMTAVRLRDSHPFRSSEARQRYLSRYDEAARAWPIPSETQMASTRHGTTFVRISGPSQAPPLVLLPGVWSTSLMWMPVIEGLSADFRTYAVDNICDFGRSVSAQPIKSIDGFMQWLDALLDALDLSDGVNLMGCSRGGWLCAEYVLHAPHRLRSAVWHSPAAVALVDYWAGLKGMPRSMAAVLSPSLTTVGALMESLMPDLARSDPDAFREYVEDATLGLRCFDSRVVGSVLGPRRFSDVELGDVSVPVLYVAGEHETMYSPHAAAARLQAVAPQVETVIIAGAGHDLGTGVQHDEFTRTVLRFLKESAGEFTQQAE